MLVTNIDTKLRYVDPWSEINSWILHFLPTLVNLQGDDQLDRAEQNSSVRPTEYSRSRGPVSPHLQFFHPGLSHVSGAVILLEEDDVSCLDLP